MNGKAAGWTRRSNLRSSGANTMNEPLDSIELTARAYETDRQLEELRATVNENHASILRALEEQAKQLHRVDTTASNTALLGRITRAEERITKLQTDWQNDASDEQTLSDIGALETSVGLIEARLATVEDTAAEARREASRAKVQGEITAREILSLSRQLSQLSGSVAGIYRELANMETRRIKVK
jgi:hypothetical protein